VQIVYKLKTMHNLITTSWRDQH